MHEYFEPFNKPNYLYEVAGDAAKKGLNFICEASWSSSLFPPVGKKLREALKAECKGDRVRFEQFIDFITNKTFRQTLFTKAEVKDEAELKIDMLDTFFISGKFSYDGVKKHYKNTLKSVFMPREMGELWDKLNEIYPSSLNVGEFMKKYKTTHSEEEVQKFYANLAYVLYAQMASFSLYKSKSLKDKPEKPKLSKVSQNLLEFIKANPNLVSFFNSNYDFIYLNPDVDFELFAMFDGSKDISSLEKELVKIQESGKFNFILEDKVVINKDKIKKMAKTYIDEKVSLLFDLGYLV